MHIPTSRSHSAESGLSCRYGNDSRQGMGMDLSTTQRLLKAMQTAGSEFGLDTSIRQIQVFLLAATAGAQGTDASTIERKTGSSQAAVSRALTKLGPTPGNLGLVEFTVDPADRRRVYVSASAKGRQVLARINKNFE